MGCVSIARFVLAFRDCPNFGVVELISLAMPAFNNVAQAEHGTTLPEE